MCCSSLLSLVYLLVSAHLGEGSLECVDLEPCQEYIQTESCENPGIWRYCMKFCNVCSGTGMGFQCNTGYVKIDDGCTPCSYLLLSQRLTARGCSQDCPRGSWGSSCSYNCSQGCYSRACERWAGDCFNGCIDGRYGNQCELHCENCGGSGRCTDGGECLEGCKADWRGQRCLQRD